MGKDVVSSEGKIEELGSVELEGRKIDFDILGMAVLGREDQILVRDDIGVVKAVVFAHDAGKKFTWINPPKPKYKKIMEKKMRELLKKRWE
ncbi:unnamed protein product [marine sediment metagenome]|uniref:Uncharacterized protein n=1 Tax=marine sediment metagenome TaxID=412755 RepID=X1N8E0_9ZZZZ